MSTYGYETQAETEEREAVQAGALEYVDLDEAYATPTVCCPSPEAAAAALCACGGRPYL